MIETKKTTAPEASVGADVVQPSQKFNTNIIANEPAQINLQTTENEKKFALNTVSMSELYDTVYPPRKPIVDGLLYGGTYLFVGAPKVGKSFFMGQLAYHVAMGLPLWEYKVHQGTVLYLALGGRLCPASAPPFSDVRRGRSGQLVLRNTGQNFERGLGSATGTLHSRAP